MQSVDSCRRPGQLPSSERVTILICPFLLSHHCSLDLILIRHCSQTEKQKHIWTLGQLLKADTVQTTIVTIQFKIPMPIYLSQNADIN